MGETNYPLLTSNPILYPIPIKTSFTGVIFLRLADGCDGEPVYRCFIRRNEIIDCLADVCESDASCDDSTSWHIRSLRVVDGVQTYG